MKLWVLQYVTGNSVTGSSKGTKLNTTFRLLLLNSSIMQLKG